MTKYDAAHLEHMTASLKDKYENTLKGTQSMVKASMRIAYAKGIHDVINLINKEGFDIVRKVTEETPNILPPVEATP